MTRRRSILVVGLVGLVLTGVVVLIVVEVAAYDGRAPAEIKSDERAKKLASLGRCPEEPLGDFEEGHDPGTKGETVPRGPASVLLCSLTEVQARNHKWKFVTTEKVLRHHLAIGKLVDALDSLPPAVPLPEGEYACPEAEGFYMLIGLRYAGAPEVQLAIAPGFCGGTAVLNLNEEKEFEASVRLMRLLDRLLESGPDANRGD